MRPVSCSPCSHVFPLPSSPRSCAASCHEAAPPVIKPAPPTAVQTVTLEKGDIQRWLTRPAQVRAQQQAVLFAKITSYLKSLAVDEGDAVKAGQVLAEIEVPELVADGAKYRAEREAARIEYEPLETIQKKTPDLITRQSVDAAKARLDIAQAAAATARDSGQLHAHRRAFRWHRDETLGRPRRVHPRSYVEQLPRKERRAAHGDGFFHRPHRGRDSRAGRALCERRQHRHHPMAPRCRAKRCAARRRTSSSWLSSSPR